MSKSSELDKTVKNYIIKCVDASGYDVPAPISDKQKVKFLHETFFAEYGWAIARMGEVKALAEWFSGLPSACTIAFYNDDILELAYKWGSLKANATKAEEQRVLDNWFNFVANKTAQLFRKHVQEG